MSRSRQAVSAGAVVLTPDTPVGAVVVGSIDLHQGRRLPAHSHPVHQLAWASSGVLSVSIAGDTWLLPPTRALWIPPGFSHSVRATSMASMRSPYFIPDRCPVRWDVPTVIAVGALLHELISYLSREDLSEGARLRGEAVLFDLLEPVSVATLRLPMPDDLRARRVADALLAHPADGRTLEAWARDGAVSERSLARLFTRETGLTFGRWRTTLRLRESLPLLASGHSVASVSRRVGYETPSAFVAAFRRELGVTPAAHFAA